jgi:N-methylhydantoinase A/oxoprolinase/acetone carboxylase beta subunit
MFFACVDIGGTFTDLVVYSDATGLEIFKAPTTPGEFERGFMDAFGLAAERHGLALDAFLAKADWPRLRYARDQHWNAEGHRVVGTALASVAAPVKADHIPGRGVDPVVSGLQLHQ